MAKVDWTDQQKEAIDHRHSSVIVSAAAGSGKTAVLVERVIRLIDSFDIDRLIIVTFTNAAAAQMREKIAAALIEKISSADSREKAERYKKQLLLLPAANICTVHSFCLRLVRDNFAKLGLAADFAIGDASECNVILNQSLEELIETKFEEQDKDFLSALSALANKNVNTFSDMLAGMHKFVKDLAFPKDWFELAMAGYDKEKLTDTSKAKARLEEIIKKHKKMLEILKVTPGCEKPVEAYETDLAIFEGKNLEDYDDLFECVHSSPKTISVYKKEVPEEVVEKSKQTKSEFLNTLKALRPLFLFKSATLCDFVDRQRADAETLIKLVCELDNIFSEKKRAKNIVDYNDLEHFALKLLVNKDKTPTETAIKLSESFDEIIIDEYQDTSPSQDAIFSAVSKNMSNIFMVGDMKQSIYCFRNTAPEIFREKTESYAREDTDGKRIFLNKNFRSRRNILDFTNKVFSKIMNLVTGEVDYNKDEFLYYNEKGYQGDDPTIDIHVLQKPKADDELSAIEQEGYKIAEIISSLVGKLDLKEGEGTRKAQYKDFAVLIRNAANRSDVIADCLTACKIPVYNDDGKNRLFSSYETQVVVSYLKIIDNPYQDIPFAAVLRSPLYNFSDELLVKIRQSGERDTKFYDLIGAYTSEDELENLKIKIFLEDYKRFGEKAKNVSVASLICEIIEKTFFEEYVTAMQGGMQRRSNLNFLVNTARNFEGVQNKGLFSFLIYLENFDDYSNPMISPKILPAALDVVKISTIHKSKGLEYPIVIVCDMGDKVASKDLKNHLLLHKKLGIGVNHDDSENNLSYPSPLRADIANKIKEENLSEEMRILYVALTRAKEKLVLLGSVSDVEKSVKEWSDSFLCSREKLSPEAVSNVKNYLDMVLYGCGNELFYKNNKLITLSFDGISINPGAEEPDEAEEKPLPEISDSIREKLEYVYPGSAGSFYSKYSVSELKKLLFEDEHASDYFGFSGSFVKKKELKMSGAERGTVVHLVMEKTDEKKINCEKDLENAIALLVEEGIITHEEAEWVSISELYPYYTSPLCIKLKAADEVYKEAPFNILIDSSVIDKERGGEKIQVQGVIDCYFRQGDEFYIVDYKTDTLDQFNEKDRIDLYTRQLAFYKIAVSKMHETDKIRCFIHFTQYNRTIEV